MADDKQNSVSLPYRLSEPPDFGGREIRDPEPDVGKQPALSYYDRHPEHRPRRQPWRRTLRQRLSESA